MSLPLTVTIGSASMAVASSACELYRPRLKCTATEPKSRIIKHNVADFLADRTATQYDRLLAEYCRLGVCLSVCYAVQCGSLGRCKEDHTPTERWWGAHLPFYGREPVGG